MVARKVTKRASKKPATRSSTKTILWVYKAAKKDPEFFNALLKDPEGALSQKGVTVNARDLQDFKAVLGKVYEFTGEDLLRLLVKPGAQTTFPWPRFYPWAKNQHWPG